MFQGEARKMASFAVLFAAIAIVLARPVDKKKNESSNASEESNLRPKRSIFTEVSCSATPQKFIYMNVEHDCFDKDRQANCDQQGFYEEKKEKCYKCCVKQKTTARGKLRNL